MINCAPMHVFIQGQWWSMRKMHLRPCTAHSRHYLHHCYHGVFIVVPYQGALPHLSQMELRTMRSGLGTTISLQVYDIALNQRFSATAHVANEAVCASGGLGSSSTALRQHRASFIRRSPKGEGVVERRAERRTGPRVRSSRC